MDSESSVRCDVIVDQASLHQPLWREGVGGGAQSPGYGSGGTDQARNGTTASEHSESFGMYSKGPRGAHEGAHGMMGYKRGGTCEIEEERPLPSPASPREFGVPGNGTSSASEGSFEGGSAGGSAGGVGDFGSGGMILMRRPSEDEIRMAEEGSRLERAAIEAKLVAARKALGKEAQGKQVKEVKGLQTAEAQLRAIEMKKQAAQSRGLDMRSSLENLLIGMKGRGIITTTPTENVHLPSPMYDPTEHHNFVSLESAVPESPVNNKSRLPGRETLSSGGGGQSPKTALDREAMKDLEGGKKKGRLRFFSYTTGGSGKKGFGGTRS